jgi:DNA-binding transcriptional ArsR family regulator
LSSNTDTVDIVFEALSDRARRDLLSEIVCRATTATDLAADRTMSRQGVSKHLAVLSNAGLVERKRIGRRVFYRVNGAALFSALAWISDLGAQVG